MSKDGYTLEGIDVLERAFTNFPKEMEKEVKRAMRTASRPYLKAAQNALPVASWKGEVTCKTKITKKRGEILMSAGFFGKKRGTDITAWFKAYWANYGTLRRRDPGHVFQNKVKKKTSARRNEIGQPAQLFFERATEGAEQRVAEDVVSAINSAAEKMVKTINDGK